MIVAEGTSLLAEADLPTQIGDFRIAAYSVSGCSREYVVLFHGEISTAEPVLVRLHSECLTGDTFGSLRCDCGEQLAASLQYIVSAGSGILLYLHQEGRGIGLVNKIRAYALQDKGMDTVDANAALGLPVDDRDYTAAARLLTHLGVGQVRLLTNNPSKWEGLEENGVEVVERVPLVVTPNAVNLSYLRTKLNRMGHVLPGLEPGNGRV